MNPFRWSVLLGMGIVLAAATAQDPAPTSMQGLMSVTEAYDKSQREMSEAYRKLAVALNPVGKERLTKSQTAWTQYREAQSELLCYHLAGGPFERMEYYAQLRKETDRRTRDLQQTFEWVRKRSMEQQHQQ
jgi:uncharacterized protein YecT (DUF1311 family)